MGGTAQPTLPVRGRAYWLTLLALAVACYGAGKIVWLLTGGAGRPIALWPPAGIAVGAMVLRGVALWPAAALAAFALAAEALIFTAGVPKEPALLGAAGVAMGTALEVSVAALLVRRFLLLGVPTLTEARDVTRFALIAAPGPAAVGAMIGNAALVWAGALGPDEMARALGLAWVGDTLGILVFAPLVLVLASGAAAGEAGWRRRLVVALPVLLATALVVWAFVRSSRFDQRRAEAVVAQRESSVTGAVQRSLAYHLDGLQALADFVGSSGRLDPKSFGRMASGAVVRHFAYSAFAWAPAPVDGQPVRVELVEPRSADPGLAGLELTADFTRHQRLTMARHNGDATVVPIGNGGALAVFVPAPGRAGQHGVEGFFGAVLRLDALVEGALAGVAREGVGLELRDGSGRVLHRATGTPVGPRALLSPRQRTVTVGDRTLVLVPVVSRAAIAAQHSGDTWIVLVAGMLFVALLEAVLLATTGRMRELVAGDSDVVYVD